MDKEMTTDPEGKQKLASNNNKHSKSCWKTLFRNRTAKNPKLDDLSAVYCQGRRR